MKNSVRGTSTLAESKGFIIWSNPNGQVAVTSDSDLVGSITVRPTPPLDFDVLDYDKIIAKVHVDWKAQKATVKQFSEDKLKIPFPFLGSEGELNSSKVLKYFKSRVFPETRFDMKQLLEGLGVNSYSPLSIVKKTHGVLFDDYIWIRFAGEDNLRYEDVGSRVVPPEWRRDKDGIDKQR